jgi:hypothetical protein
MLVSYSQKGTVVEAVEKTFDGEHPCALCRAIEAAAEKKKAPVPPSRIPQVTELLKLCQDMLPLEQITAAPPVFADSHEPDLVSYDVSASRRNVAPPSPPPRFGDCA